MTAGYSGTPLVKKLGIKEGNNCMFIDQPSHYFDLLVDPPAFNQFSLVDAENGSIDFAHFFVQFEKDLFEKWNEVKSKIAKDGMLWISWPKGKSKLERDLDENVIRKTGLEGGLVDVKICAVDDDWSGLKFMYRRKDR